MLDKLLTAQIATPIEAIGNVFDRLFTSDAERAQAEAVLEKLRQHPAELQVELNKIEAAHRSVFVAGWRPAVGWICALAVGWAYLGHPLFLWAAIRRLGRAGFREMVVGCLKMADYAIERFEAAGIAAWRNNNSVTVVFPRPPAPVLFIRLAAHGLPEVWRRYLPLLDHHHDAAVEAA